MENSHFHNRHTKTWIYWILVVLSILVIPLGIAVSQEQESEQEYDTIDSEACLECHETGKHDTVIVDELSHSTHDGMECLDCHQDKDTLPHKEKDPKFRVGCEGCRVCHTDVGEQYQIHGMDLIVDCEDAPTCAHCHGDHDVLPSSVRLSKTHPSNLPQTCGVCHEDIDLTREYEILLGHTIAVYKSSVHGRATSGEVFDAATCNDCHSTEGSAHKIFSAGNLESSINHFNIPRTCGKCHENAEKDYWEGIHGKLTKRGITDSPVCTHCHGEHGIISPSDPRSPVSKERVAEATCSPCHESISLTEKYGVVTESPTTFIDTYHGLKSKAGDLFVANCASCHGVHKILPSSDPASKVHPDNLQETCGECHPGISAELAAVPIHGVAGEVEPVKAAGLVKTIYIILIVVVIGAMALHWLIDLFRQIKLVMKKSQVRRMRIGEVWQHHLLMLSFIVLVISGFSLRFGDSWFTGLFFGWPGGFALRGIIHRVAAVVLMVVTAWHIFYLFSRRGKQFLKDMFPKFSDFIEFVQRILYNLGLSKKTPSFKRFSYVEKAEYWALIWGNIVMILTGIMLWFDNYFVKILPKGALDVSLVIHYYEAILASLAILIWHMYATVFNPHVYPMNPAWLTGKMPEDMFRHEHPGVEDEEIER